MIQRPNQPVRPSRPKAERLSVPTSILLQLGSREMTSAREARTIRESEAIMTVLVLEKQQTWMLRRPRITTTRRAIPKPIPILVPIMLVARDLP